MLHIPIASKVVSITFRAMVLSLVLVATDTSPYTVYILGALVPISLFVAQQLWSLNRQKSVETKAKDKDYEETKRRLNTLETQMTPFWATLQTKLADALHHPHPEAQRSDRLLEKLESMTISGEERAELRHIAQGIMENPKVSIEEKAKAQMLLLVMPLVTSERHSILATDAKIKAAAVIQATVLPESMREPESKPQEVIIKNTEADPANVKPVKDV